MDRDITVEGLSLLIEHFAPLAVRDDDAMTLWWANYFIVVWALLLINENICYNCPCSCLRRYVNGYIIIIIIIIIIRRLWRYANGEL